MFQIAGFSLETGEKLQTYYALAPNYKVPLTVINGDKYGKTIFITAGIHGSEYVAIQTAELASTLQPKDIAGQVIIMHPVNVSAHYSRSFAVLPEDNKNLNRAFPGDKNGTLSRQIAYELHKTFQQHADFYIDLHGGDLHEVLTPFVFYPGVATNEVVEESLRIAKALNVPYRLRSNAKTGSYNFTAISGCPSILIERGGCGHWDKQEVINYKQDICSALYHLNVLAHNPYIGIKLEQKELINPVYIDADKQGCWYPSVQAGSLIKKDQLLGKLKDFFGNTLQTYYAESDALVMYIAVSLGISKEMPLIAYASIL